MQKQLDNWGLPAWFTYPEREAERPKAPKSSPSERKARGSGPVVDLPPAGRAAVLFHERLEVLLRAAEELRHRKEKLQGGRFLQSSVYTDPVFVSRVGMSDEQWQSVRDALDLDPDTKDSMYFGGSTFSLGGGSETPGAPLPALIGAYLLAGGEVEALVEALHPDPASADRSGIEKRIEGRKGDPKYQLDGIRALAEQLAKAIRGGTLRPRSPAAELPPDEINLACRITELRDQDWSDRDVYQKLHQINNSYARELSWEDFQRLAALELRFPWA